MLCLIARIDIYLLPCRWTVEVQTFDTLICFVVFINKSTIQHERITRRKKNERKKRVLDLGCIIIADVLVNDEHTHTEKEPKKYMNRFILYLVVGFRADVEWSAIWSDAIQTISYDMRFKNKSIYFLMC